MCHRACRIREEQAMLNDRQLIATVDAKPAAAGFGLRAPNLFGPARDYLSNEIQKAAIIAMMITRRPTLKQAAFVMVLVMWVFALASLVWLYEAGRDNPTPTDLVVMIVVMVAPMMAALYLASGRALRRLRPGFAGRSSFALRKSLAVQLCRFYGASGVHRRGCTPNDGAPPCHGSVSRMTADP
jgi:hypothetical protein